MCCAFKQHQGVPTVAKLSVKLITQYVEITLGSEIVFYGRFHRFCSCQRLSLARLQGSTCQKKSNKTWKLKRHLDTQNFSFLDPIHWNSSKQSTKVQSLSFKSWLLWRFCNPCQVLLFLSAMVPSHSLILEEWWTRAKLMRLSGLCIEIILSCCMCTGHDKSSDHQRIFTLTLICQPSKLLIPLINLLSFIYPPVSCIILRLNLRPVNFPSKVSGLVLLPLKDLELGFQGLENRS